MCFQIIMNVFTVTQRTYYRLKVFIIRVYCKYLQISLMIEKKKNILNYKIKAFVLEWCSLS